MKITPCERCKHKYRCIRSETPSVSWWCTLFTEEDTDEAKDNDRSI